MTARDRVTAFLAEERERFPGGPEMKRRLGHLERVAELLRYLEITLVDYGDANDAYMAAQEKWFRLAEELGPGPGPLPAGHVALLKKSTELGVELHLRIETFYVFAKILLDKLAKAIHGYFGHTGSARGAALQSHGNLETNFERFAGHMKLSKIPPTLLDAVSEMTRRVVDYRDDFVTHEHSPKIAKATTFNRWTGQAWISPLRVYPTTPSQSAPLLQSEPPPTLMELIESYVEEVLAYMEANRTRATAH